VAGADMPDEVLGILKAAARRLLLVRAAESAAVGAIAAALSAAACEMAWTVGWLSPAAAAGICAAPVLFAAWLAASPRLRRRLALSAGAACAVVAICGAGGLAGALAVLDGLYAEVPKLLVPAILVPAGALAAAAVSFARGVSPVQAAVFHDVQLGLEERLGTAAELAASARRDDPFARCVYAQALAAARGGRIASRPVWRRSRATAGALGLSVALCVALALLPTWGRVDVQRSFELIRAGAADLTPAKRKDLVETLRRLAELAREDPAIRKLLREAAEAAAREQGLPEKLEELEGALANADDAEAARIARELLAAASPGGTSGGPNGAAGPPHAGGDANRPLVPDANSIVGDGAEKPLLARVYVYDKSYRGIADANAPPPGRRVAVGQGALVPLDDAWSAARDRASAALAAGSVPAEYRRLVRRFFELD